VVLLQILPVALLAPWWLQSKSIHFQWRSFYLKLVAAIFIGAAIALAWAIPAGISGGDDYRHAIFFGQTSGRLVESFAHKLPFWWYLVRLPLLLLPWLLFKPFWQGIRKLSFNDYGVRFCIAWALPVFIAFSLVSGKRIHYLLPLMPALALLLARVADEIHDIASWRRAFLTVWVGICMVLLLMVSFMLVNTQTHWFNIGLNTMWLLGLATLIGVGLTMFKVNNFNHIMLTSCLISIAIPSTLAIMYLEINAPRFDTQPIAKTIAQLRLEDKGVAFYSGKYHDQFQFTGRLTQPLTLLHSPEMLKNWIEENKAGFVLVDSEKVPASLLFYSHIYRAGQLGFISSQTLIEQPDLIQLVPR
jgi:4-amino-4-deoxy-L-arabinose transferase-like glycosyltransferase